MDSKLLLKASLTVTLFVLFVFILMLGMNGYLTPEQTEGTEVQEEETAANDVEADGMVKGADLSAWMSDETFFDEEKLSTIEKMEEREKQLMLLATSIGKNIRIHILDANGKQLAGIPFHVELEGLGTYQDTDRDGVICIEDVDPGKYFVSLGKMDSFQLPEEPLLVEVREQLEYRAIEDISYLIKTEDEIDAMKEDTAVNDAAMESEGDTSIWRKEDASFGIDVSKWNKEIDWEKVKEAGVEFAMIRLGYRGSFTGSLIEDPCYKRNIQGAIENDIPAGIYFFTQAVNEIEAVEEASMVLSLIQGYQIDYPIMIDSEGSGGNGRADALSVEMRTKICEAFCRTIRSGGYTAGVYASKNWLNQRLDVSKFSKENVIWLAEYAKEPTYQNSYSMWQYTSAGRLPGIEGRVDFNQSFVSFANQINPEKEREELPKGKDEDPKSKK